ncbi:LPXTG cell wall anchor domain-containing protein [Enterococcus faecalis]|nr:LPXTG cell wall anchor domain-containing protein [Enterococcus faecalis]EIW9703238.1 LPXTG cell wall anchor domain-containing protein [Enterococcus faecalis]
MNKFLKYTFSLLIIIIGSFYSHQVVSAEELVGTGIVDLFEFSDTNLSQGQTTSVKITFSEKYKDHIKPGDTLTFPMPAGLEGMTENDGSPRKILLSDLGEALIYKDRIVATANDRVKFLEHVHGSFSFGIKSTVTNSTTDATIETNFGTTLEKKSVTVRGISQNPGTSTQPFFYKSGDLLGDSDKVRWFLNVNLNKEELSDDIVISDTHGSGQLLNKDSFNITVNNYLGSTTYTLNAFMEKGFGTIELSTDNNFIIRLKKDHARLASFTIMYTTTITTEGRKQELFENSHDVNYQIFNKERMTEKNSTSVKNLFAEGEADGDLDKQDPNEHEIETPNESVEPLPDNTPTPEKPLVEDSENPSEKGPDKSQPEIHIGEKEDFVEDESDKIKDLEDTPSTEKPLSPKDIENETNNSVDKNQPEIHIGEKEEVVEDESDKTKDLEDTPSTETPLPPKEVENETNNSVDKNQPESRISEKEDLVEDESDKIKDLKDTPSTEKPLSSKKIKKETSNTVDTNKTAVKKNSPQANQKTTSDTSMTTVSSLSSVNEKEKKILPKAGTTNNMFLTLLGLLIILFTSITVYSKYKKVN